MSVIIGWLFTMEGHGEWVESVLAKVNEHLLGIKHIWSDIGYPKNRVDELRSMLADKVITPLRCVLSDTQDEKSKLEEKVRNLKNKTVEIEKELQVPRRDTDFSQPLLVTLEELTNYNAELQLKIAELTAEFKELKSNEENLCSLLDVKALEGFPLIPSFDDKRRVQNRIEELKAIKRERESKLESMRQRILSCLDYLGTDCNLEMPQSVHQAIYMESKPSNLSECILLEVDKVQDKYMDLFHKFKSEEEDLLEKIESLRNRLAMSPYSIPEKHSTVPSQRIKYGLSELARLRELRLANLRRLTEACVLELEGIWTACYVGGEYRQTFRESTSSECSEENLSRLENEVHKWRRFKAAHQDFYDALTVWLDTLQQIKAIELKRQDPVVLKNRGGILLKLDKEDKKLRMRDLPNHTTHLESIISQECDGPDAGLFSLVCIEGQPLSGLQLAAGQKENALASLVDKRYDLAGILFIILKKILIKNGTVNPDS
ncbi:unnamed protein product [Mesocestoides corti]|uniref:Uncharacterized protein n=1 Tax=Mesocestoides corti TaxID=53468 RepID=A0A3P6GJE2_MESCO|nr:unnamed protein product [Mesocestoides corti]